MENKIEFIEYGKFFTEDGASDFQILDVSSEKILKIAGSVRCENFRDQLSQFTKSPSESSLNIKAPDFSVAFLKFDTENFLFVQIQRREEGEYARSRGNTPRVSRPYNQLRFSLVKRSQADYCFIRGFPLFSSLLYENSLENNLGNHPNALRDYVGQGGDTVGPLTIEVKEQRQEIHAALQENPNLRLLVNTIIENAKQAKRGQRLSVQLSDLDWKELLEIIEAAQILVSPVVGCFTFSIGEVTENKVDLILLEKVQDFEEESLPGQAQQKQHDSNYFSEILELHQKYGDKFTRDNFVEILRKCFLLGMSIEEAGAFAELPTLDGRQYPRMAPPPSGRWLEDLLSLFDNVPDNFRSEFLQRITPIALVGSEADLLRMFLFLGKKGMLYVIVEKIRHSAWATIYEQKALEIYALVSELRIYLADNRLAKNFIELFQLCVNRGLPILHSGMVSALTIFDDYRLSKNGVEWSQETLRSESERNILVRANLHDVFVNKIQRQYTNSTVPLDPKIEAIHIHFGHGLLDENFISILRECLNSGISLWDSVLISAVVSSNTRNLTKDQVESLKNILDSEGTLNLIKRLGMLEDFEEKLGQLGVYPKHDVKAANPQPKPIAAISLLRSTWEQKRKSNRLRISLISAWNDKKSLENLSYALVQEGFDEFETEPIYSEKDWLRGISGFHQSADVIVVILSRQSALEMQPLLEEIIESASRHDSLRIIARIEDIQTRSGLRNWYQVNLFKPGDYDRLVQELVQRYKENDESPRPMAAPPPSAPPPIIGRILGVLLTTILIVAALMIYSISLFNGSSTSQPTATPLQPIVLTPFWLGAITLIKGACVAILFTVIPLWAAKITEYKSRVSQSITEILMFSIVLSVVSFFMFKLQGDGTWMLLAIAIAAILDSGGHLLDYLRENHINQIKREINGKQISLRAKMKSSRKAVRLEKEINQYKIMQDYLYRFDQIFQRERILYISLPAGILSGVVLGVYKGAETYEYLEYSILFVALFAALTLGYFVATSFVQMLNPVYAGEYTPDDSIAFYSTDLEKFKEEKESALGFARTTTEIRSMYLYDSAHNIFLLVSFVYICFSSINYVLPLKWVVLIALASLVLLNQVPFAIGQSLLREYILKKYGSYASGIIKSELKKDEFAPLMIKPEIFTSIFTIGAGGLLIALAENFIKELFK